MNTPINDGGPAFPMSGEPNCEFDRVMTLRDYFAGHATEKDIDAQPSGGTVEGTYFEFSREQRKYIYADAMLRVRNGGDK